MKFTLLATIGLGLASAAPAAHVEREENSLAKRQGPFALAVIGGVTSAVAAKVLTKLVGKRAEQTWDSYRADALSALVAGLDDAAEADEATVCARRGEYSVDDWFKVQDRTQIAFHGDNSIDLYDCFFITGPSKVTFLAGSTAVDYALSVGPCTQGNGTLTCS